ncbi:MAG: HK97 gp10 family phage protein [Clostridiales bacterium]|nr:HK97 gp10 family phage protein [Clostridiales bacterium]
MAGKHVTVDVSELKEFVNKMNAAARGDLKHELMLFLEGLGDEMLRVVQDEIIRKQVVDTRLLLNSFERGSSDGVYEKNEGNLTIEVGTNVTYASYVNDGHWMNPKGVKTRFVPGYWDGDHFIYVKGAKTGMLLKQKWIEGSHYWDSAIRIMEQMIPGLAEAKIQQWLQKYFS